LDLRGGINQYVYAGNSPENFADPFGYKPRCKKSCDELLKEISQLRDELAKR
jgi:hypothetical protein